MKSITMKSITMTAPIRTLTIVATLGALLSGCAAEAPITPPTSTPSSSTATATPTPAPSPLAIPAPSASEIARSVFESAGANGTPTTSNTIRDVPAAGEIYVIDGECSGSSADFAILSAAVGEEASALSSGTLQCGQPLRQEFIPVDDEPVQLAFTDTTRIDEGWLRLARVEG